jgi:hypothetical protein
MGYWPRAGSGETLLLRRPVGRMATAGTPLGRVAQAGNAHERSVAGVAPGLALVDLSGIVQRNHAAVM